MKATAMKIPCSALLLATLCVSAHAEMDADTLRKLAAVKSMALSDERISAQQVSKALAVKLKKRCTYVVQPGAGKYYVCIYDAETEDKQALAFRHFKTVNRTVGEDSGGVVMFLTQGDQHCLRQEDLAKVFERAPKASDTAALPEPTLPYVAVNTYQFVFPRQGAIEVHVRVVQTGECVNTIELKKAPPMK